LVGAVPAGVVLYTNNEVAGVDMVVASVVEVSATLGINKPDFVASEATSISNFAEELGVLVPIPTFPCG